MVKKTLSTDQEQKQVDSFSPLLSDIVLKAQKRAIRQEKLNSQIEKKVELSSQMA